MIGIAAIAAGALLVHPHHSPGGPQKMEIGLACLLVLAGFGLRAWAAASNGGHTRTNALEAPWLATGGPYAYVRNPIYLGSFILGLGMVAAIGDAWLLLPHVAVFTVFFSSIICAEEDFLTRRFGKAYETYRGAVPRFLPALSPWAHRTQRQLVWTAARGELFVGLALILIYAAFRALLHFKSLG